MNQSPEEKTNAGNDGEETVARLRLENKLLALQVSSTVRLKQEVLLLNHRLDEERRRFEAMHGFIRQAVRAASADELPPLVCDSIIDLMGCGVGMFWCLRGEPDSSCFTQAGLGSVSDEQWRGMKSWVGDWLSGNRPPGDGRLREVPPLPDCIQVDGGFLVETLLDSDGVPLAVIFACNTPHQAGFHDGFLHSSDSVFSTFADQVGVLIDSALRRATIAEQAERIRMSEERLRTALTLSNVGLWDWDLTKDSVYYSEQWKSQLGLGAEAVGDSASEWEERLHPDDRENALQVAGACALAPGGSFEVTLRMRHESGKWLWINAHGFNVSEDGGRQRMIGIHIDVTGFKTLEAKLLRAEREQRRAREQAEQESRAKSSFLAAVSHEIRTPLNGIMAAFQMLARTEEAQERKRLVGMGLNAGEWLLKIIGESLDISRIEAGVMELHPEAVDLRKLLAGLKEMMSERAVGDDVDFRWEVADDVPAWVMVDAVRLRQILSNLIENALKFTRSGHVSVDVTLGRRATGARRYVRFSVRDTGIGFSREFRKVMFEPYRQETTRSESKQHGIGLGLVVIRQFTRLMGGRVRVWSEPGVGSRFVVSLPLETARDPGDRGLGGGLAALPGFAGRVLLAEDDPASGLLGKMMLEQLGVEVDLAQDGGSALEQARNGSYDLIFMDCWMPVWSGIEVSRMLRASDEAHCRAVPIIALTANAQESDKRACHEAGMNGFMTKPLLFDALLETLDQYLPQAGEQGAGRSLDAS